MGCSAGSQKPPGMSHRPYQGSCALRTSGTRPDSVTSAPAHGLALAQWAVPQAGQVTGGKEGRGLPQLGQNTRGSLPTRNLPCGSYGAPIGRPHANVGHSHRALLPSSQVKGAFGVPHFSSKRLPSYALRS